MNAEDIKKMHHCELEIPKAHARMVDVLLRQVIGKELFSAHLDKKSNIVTFGFWASEEVFDSIVFVLKREEDELWDSAYEELMAETY